MTSVQAVAVRWADDAFPGFVEVVLTDTSGHAWNLFDKAPVFGDGRLTARGEYPFTVQVDCDMLRTDVDGTALVALRHGVEAEDGVTRFLVAREQIHGS